MSAFPTNADIGLAPHINTGKQVLTEFCGERRCALMPHAIGKMSVLKSRRSHWPGLFI